MLEIRFHGRGGQGAVTASKILALAAFNEDRYVLAFPFFGTERRGAPVTSFTRIDDKRIFLRTQIYEPDVIVVLDPSVMGSTDVAKGLKEGGKFIITLQGSRQTLISRTGLQQLMQPPLQLGIILETGQTPS